jgi:hypothetical protein
MDEICSPDSRAFLDRTPAGAGHARIAGVTPAGATEVVVALPGRPEAAVLPVRDDVFAGRVPGNGQDLARATVRAR